MLLDFIKSNWKEITTWLALFGVVVEVSPIKIYSLRWVGNRMNADIKKELDNVNESLNKHITDSEKKEMKNLRFQMLDFADRVQNDSKPSKDAFSHIFDTIQDYHDIIDKYELKNGLIDIETENLKQAYKKLYT